MAESSRLNFQDAAEKACEEDDCGSAEYAIVLRGFLDKILIRDESGIVKEFSVEAESVPHYSATENKV